MAVASRGAALVFVALLVVVAERPKRAAAVAGALAGSCLRWGTTTLGPIAGAQAVLGPAGWTGGVAAVASAWAAAVALICAAPPALPIRSAWKLIGRPSEGRRVGPPAPRSPAAASERVAHCLPLLAPSAPGRSGHGLAHRLGLFSAPGGALIAVPFGLGAGLVVAGPGPGGLLVLRSVAALIATGLAALVSIERARARFNRWTDLTALGAGIAAAVLGGLAR